MRKRTVSAVLASLFLTFGLRAGIDPKDFDTSVKPQDDFYEFANGGWLKTNPVPPEYSSWGAFNELDERNKLALRKILDQAAAAKTPDANQKRVGDFYASGMDITAIEAAGTRPLRPELDRIAGLKTATDVQAEIARLHLIGVPVCFGFGSEPDPKNSDVVIAAAGQGGLGLPDRDYYLRDDEKSQKLREQYITHVATILRLGGESIEGAMEQTRAVMRIETALAKGSKTRVELRDPVANYHRMTEAELMGQTLHFDWPVYFAAIGVTSPGDIDIGQPEFFKTLDGLLGTTPLADWQAYLRWHLLHDAASSLGADFVDENFDFYGKTLTGQQKLRERWKRVLGVVNGMVGEALGQLYVGEYFPPESKAQMLKLVHNLEEALRDRINKLEWMDEPTRKLALAKLDAFTVKIGYPDNWRDYSALKIDRGPFVLNVQRASLFLFKRDLAKIGKRVDRTEWSMSPPTVNAYYNPQMNEIVFPAGILQPPFFDPKADDAINYGGIGAVIGHEMTHGFDDQGRQFDAKGNLTDWWTSQSATNFQVRAKGIVKQFDDYVAVDDLHVNGALTTGENIADLGGLKIAYAALQQALAEKPAPDKIDGYTPTQRFFLSWATVWRTNQRPEVARLRAQTDPHSPPRLRVLGPLSNLPEFIDAFDVPEGSPMRRAPADRVEIW
jgi:putative endopeptidase